MAIKLAVVVAFILLGAGYVHPANWHPFVPDNTGAFGEFGWSGVLRGASVVFFAFIGFDAVSTCAQEAKRPQRDMPIGILGSLVICTILYIAVSAVLTGLVPYTELPCLIRSPRAWTSSACPGSPCSSSLARSRDSRP